MREKERQALQKTDEKMIPDTENETYGDTGSRHKHTDIQTDKCMETHHYKTIYNIKKIEIKNQLLKV